jgi:glycosyltransferase involved in cell wall biosynthesis
MIRSHMSSNNRMLTLAQTAIGDYRQEVLELIQSRLNDRFVVLCGKEYFDKTTITKVRLGSNLSFVNNFFFLNRRLLWQSGVFFPAIRSHGLILEFNPRILSNWIILILRRLLSRSTVLWGHAWGREGAISRTAWLRRLMRSLCSTLLVYTEQQKLEIIAEGKFHGNVVAAPNAIYREAQMQPAIGELYDSFIYVGRLVPSKFPDRIIPALVQANLFVSGARLIFVGEGPMKAELIEQADAYGVSEFVSFHGHVSDPIVLRQLYAKSVFSLSPGYVGLSITQSLGFGVPMIISRNEPHAPEIEAASEGVNSMYFQSDEPLSFSEILSTAWRDRSEWAKKRELISKICRENYSAEQMAKRIIESVFSNEQR